MKKWNCKFCGAQIISAESTTTGKIVPLNAKPVPAWNLNADGTCTQIGLPTYTAHFVSCTDPAAFAKDHKPPEGLGIVDPVEPEEVGQR